MSHLTCTKHGRRVFVNAHRIPQPPFIGHREDWSKCDSTGIRMHGRIYAAEDITTREFQDHYKEKLINVTR